MAKQSLLVADADPRSLRILEVALRKAGFAVTTASDGAEVLRKLQRMQLDALLCELSLPGEDGLSVCRSVRADARLGALPILLMNADREAATRASALQAGADDFLPKPLLIKEVVARVRTLLAQREQERNSQRGAPAAITGTVGDLGLVDLFTSLDNWQRSATVLCEGDGRNARVWVRDGQVVDADVPPLTGEAAFYRLLNWDAGSFRVDFGPVDREARTDAGTQGLLMEGMRRIDEIARLADTLPLSTVLAVDFPRLLTQLAEMPDELNGVLRLFDGVRTVREVIAGSPIDDLSTMAAVQKLMGDGVLVRGAPSAPRQKPSLQQWLGSTPPPPSERAVQKAPSGGAHRVADEELPFAEVVLTPPEGQAGPGARASDSQSESAAGASAADASDEGARVTPIRPRRSVRIVPSDGDAPETESGGPASSSGRPAAPAGGSARSTPANPRAAHPTSQGRPPPPPLSTASPASPASPHAPPSSSAASPSSAASQSSASSAPSAGSRPSAASRPPSPGTGSRGRTFSTDPHASGPVRHRHTAVSVPPATVGIGGTGPGAASRGGAGGGTGSGSGTEGGVGTAPGVGTRAGASRGVGEGVGTGSPGDVGDGAGSGLGNLGSLEDGAPVESSAGYGTGAPLGVDAAVKLGIGAGRIVLLRYPPLRGSRRERLRREAEEARQSIAAGRPVRMTHVLELPPTPGGDDATPEGSRRMSVAVGEVARRFAPDLPIGRLVRPWTPTGAAADTSAATRADGGESPGQSGARGSTPPRGAAHAKVPAQQIGAALADALAASRLEGANESTAAEPLDATPAPRSPRATSAPRSRSYVTAGLLAIAGVAAAVAVALFVRRHHDAGQSANSAAAQTDGNATTSLVPTPPPATTPSPGPVEPPPAPAPADAHASAQSSATEYARAVATGDTLLKQGRYRGAIAEYRKAVALRPDSVPALIALGDAFLEADQPRNAVKPLQQAARLDPGSARAQLLLGTAFQSLDRPRDAVAAYKRYLDLEPSGEFAGDVRAIVANLSK